MPSETVRSETVAVPGGAYRLLTAECAAKEPDWYEVWEQAEGEAVRLLLPTGLYPPEGFGIFPFAGRALNLAWMRDALIHRLAADVGQFWSVGVYDPAGAAPSLPLALLPYAADIRVVTDAAEKYEAVARRALEEFGAPLLIGGDRRILEGVMWMVAPDGPGSLSLRGQWGTFSGAAGTWEGVADAYLPKDAEMWLSLTPKGIAPERFLAGLYECSGVTRLADPPPAYIRMNGRFAPIDRE